MSLLLLTGAGFSRNWGGWLAREVHTDIAMRLSGDLYLRELLQKHNDFEGALEAMQNEYRASASHELVGQRLASLQEAISATFGTMNEALSQAQFDFHNGIDVSMGVFLAKFDAIFTLNQDLLLERHYHYPRERMVGFRSLKWRGAETPGMEEIPDPNYYADDRPLRVKSRPRQPPFVMNSGIQPYFKLHGSMNWFSQDGEQMLIMGGDKLTTMQRYPILRWYADKFLEYLSGAGARLMVIGYGFRDQHINSMLLQAWQSSHFEMFIIGPDGKDILRKVNPTYNLPTYRREPLEDITAYESTRGLSSTFGGSDPAEHGKLMRFLAASG
jgi:SIR2-like domain